MKYGPVLLFILFIVMISDVNAKAEYVFKKDGAVIKGNIVSDDVATISVKGESGTVERIDRKDIMRIIYTDLYLGKVYARLTTGEVVEGYQVDEDRDDYFFRKDITKPEEFTIPRRKVMFIARTNPTDLKGLASVEVIELSWSPPFKPAKFYRGYMRDVKSREEKFRLVSETDDLTVTLKDLKKSWSYEFYATAISDTGEESLPSEKLVVNTLPEAPEKLNIEEKTSADGKTVTLTLTWRDVTDTDSRVKSYNIYETEGGERKKKGTSAGGEFVIKDFPAEGRHWFSVAAVNDLFTESDEIKAVYDAGYKIYIRGMGTYIYPMGTMTELASYGYGGIVDAGVSKKNFSFGLESGYLYFNTSDGVDSMIFIPALLEFDYRIKLLNYLSLNPVFKAGGSYNTVKYIVHDRVDPLITGIKSSSSFDPMLSAGGYLHIDFNETVNVVFGAEYSVIFQKDGRLDYAACSIGAEFVF